jgi:hypothetical protein
MRISTICHASFELPISNWPGVCLTRALQPPTVAREHLLAVMELQAGAKLQRPCQAVGVDGMAFDHLWRGLELGVPAVEPVEYEIAAIAGDEGCRPYRVEHG